MQVIVENLLTSYEQAGDGSVVLLLHGWGDSRATFASLAKALQKNHTVVALDLPGFGGTAAPEATWGLNDYCDFVAKFLKKIQVTHLHAVVGHSNGGSIAIRGLARGNVQADKLVLLASAGVRDVYRGRKKALRIAAKAAKLLTYPLPKKLQDKVKKRAYHAVGSDMFVAEHLQETFKRVVTDDVRSDAARLNLPALLIYGSNDQATPVAYGKMFSQAISGSKLQVIDGAEHFVHHDKPGQVNKLVEEFLA